jgi:hypothetical protein
MSTLEPPARAEKASRFTLYMSQLQMKHGRKLVIALPYVWPLRYRWMIWLSPALSLVLEPQRYRCWCSPAYVWGLTQRSTHWRR